MSTKALRLMSLGSLLTLLAPATFAQVTTPVAASAKLVNVAARPAGYQNWMRGLAPVPGSWSGSLGLRYLHGGQSASSATSATTSKTDSFGETLTLNNSGFYWISPLLFTGALGVDFDLSQDRSSASDNESSSQGKAIGYSFDGTFLAEKPYPVSISAHRTQINTVQSYGATVRGTNSAKRILFSLHPDSFLNDMGYPWTEGSLEIAQEKAQTTTTSYGRSLVTDEQGKALMLRASKGFETADLSFSYNANERKNMASDQIGLQSQIAQLNYSLDFGPTLNRRFDSNLNYQSRNGPASTEILTGIASLQVDYSQKLHSQHSFGVSQMTAGDSKSQSRNLASSVSHQLYQNLSTSVGVNASNSVFQNGSTSTMGGQIGQSYRHSLPAQGKLNVNWTAGSQTSKNQLTSPDITVTEERHYMSATDISGRFGFKLDRDLLVPGNVPKVYYYNPSTTVLQLLIEKVDYSRETRGNQTWIIPEPTSLWWIGIPGPLEFRVSYAYQVDPNLDTRTQSRSIDFGVDYHWINVTFGGHQSTETATSLTEPQFLQNSDQKFIQVGLQGNVFDKPASGSLNLQDNHASNDANRQIKFTGQITLISHAEAEATLTLQANQAKYTLPNLSTSKGLGAQGLLRWSDKTLVVGLTVRDSNYFSPDAYTDTVKASHATLNWYAENGWVHAVGLEWSQHRQRTEPAEVLMQAKAQSSITLGKLSLSVSAAFGQWVRASQRSINQSLSVSAVRQF